MAGAAFGAGLGFAGGPAIAAAQRPALPIPPELRPDQSGIIRLRTQAGSRRFVPAGPTPTFGINGDFLGPAIRVKRGESVSMEVTNGLAEETTLHWHGLKIPGIADGGPHSLIQPGGTWTARLDIDQPAATCWFHPHPYPKTAEQVIKGLAGLFVIDDAESAQLGPPSRWGVDDIPLILQDRRFNEDGTFFHRFNLIAVTTGYIGDQILVNGARYPVATTARGWLRLRLLNGSNARSYRLKASDSRPLHVIGSDGGLLPEAVQVEELPLYVGERYEVMVYAGDGKPFDLVTLPVMQLGMNLPPFDGPVPLLTVVPDGPPGDGKLPDRLAALPPADAGLAQTTRQLTIDMTLDSEGMGQLMKAGLKGPGGKVSPEVAARVTKLIVGDLALSPEKQLSANTINGRPYAVDEPVFATVPRGQYERWIISEGSDRMLHPIHVHGCQFRVLTVDGKPPPAYMAGWKDTIPVSAGSRSELLVRFDHPAPASKPFMAHCHILEHEDSGMMTQFSVT